MTTALPSRSSVARPHGRGRPRRSVPTLLASTAALTLLAATLGGCSDDSAAGLSLDAPLPTTVPDGTVLRIGDPSIQVALGASGLDKELSDAGVKIEWANISGGPQSIQAFRGNKLDCSSVADIPSLFAHWTGTSTKIVFQAVTVDPLEHPVYQLGVAPGAQVTSLADLKGKRIAYSAGQAQGALVLRVLQKAGLTQDDVTLVDLPSTTDTYKTALGTKSVDVAPLGASTVHTYLHQYPGSTAIDTGIRDDASTVYCLTKAVEDPAKAAALRVYVATRAKALLWIDDHPDEWQQVYYEKNQGLSAEDAKQAVSITGDKGIPADWDAATKRLQATADLLAAQQDHPPFDVSEIVDDRFAQVEADAVGSAVLTGDAS